MFEREFFRKTLGILFAFSFDTREEKVDSLDCTVGRHYPSFELICFIFSKKSW